MSGQVLGLITARGGSQRLPGKNLALLGGRSLLQRTIDAARASVIDRLILSSDDPQIIAAARSGGAEAPFVRPEALAGPTASSIDVIRHAMTWVEAEAPGRYDILVLLQPTSPLRIAADIDATTAFHDMPWRRSVDIDTAGDLALATALIAETGEDTP